MGSVMDRDRDWDDPVYYESEARAARAKIAREHLAAREARVDKLLKRMRESPPLDTLPLPCNPSAQHPMESPCRRFRPRKF